MKYVYRILVIFLIIFCALPILVLSALVAIWSWDETIIGSAFTDILEGKFTNKITENWK